MYSPKYYGLMFIPIHAHIVYFKDLFFALLNIRYTCTKYYDNIFFCRMTGLQMETHSYDILQQKLLGIPWSTVYIVKQISPQS